MTIPTRETPALQRLTPRAGSGSIAAIRLIDSARRLRLAALLAVAVSLFGVFACDFLRSEGLARPLPSSGNIFFRLYAHHEPPFLWLLVTFAAVIWWLAPRLDAADTLRWRPARKPLAADALLAAAAVLAVTLAGASIVMHSTLLSMDEYAAAFEARILATGRLAAPVPPDWQPFAQAVVPHFISYRAAEQVWLAGYLPAYAGLRALFSVVSAEAVLNPLLAALAVLSLAGAASRLWPGDSRRGRLAIIYLATSTQFLLMSMTGYSWPAHLTFNLLWLYLLLREDRIGLATAPWIGALALGLHNPFPHALFAAPFLLRLLRSRRIEWIAYYAGVYGAGAFGWYSLMSYSQPQVGRGEALEVFRLPSVESLFVQGMNLSLVLTWQAPAMALFFVAALFVVRSLKPAERDLMAGLLLTFAFYFLFPENQGHGWGYRYVYSALGSAALLAASATVALTGHWGAVGQRLVLASVAVAALVQLPLRSIQAERVVRPYAATLAHIARLPADVVLVDPNAVYYGRDLIRNDPLWRTRPITLSFPAIRPDDGRELLRRFPGRVYLLTPPEMERLGLTTFGPPRAAGAPGHR